MARFRGLGSLITTASVDLCFAPIDLDLNRVPFAGLVVVGSAVSDDVLTPNGAGQPGGGGRRILVRPKADAHAAAPGCKIFQKLETTQNLRPLDTLDGALVTGDRDGVHLSGALDQRAQQIALRVAAMVVHAVRDHKQRITAVLGGGPACPPRVRRVVDGPVRP